MEGGSTVGIRLSCVYSKSKACQLPCSTCCDIDWLPDTKNFLNLDSTTKKLSLTTHYTYSWWNPALVELFFNAKKHKTDDAFSRHYEEPWKTKSVHYKKSYLSGNALAAAPVFWSGGSFFYQTAAAAAANEEFCFSYLWWDSTVDETGICVEETQWLS